VWAPFRSKPNHFNGAVSAGPEISCFKTDVYYCAYKSPISDAFLIHLNPLLIFSPHSCKIYLNFILPWTPTSSKWPLSFITSDWNSVRISHFQPCITHLIVRCLIIITIPNYKAERIKLHLYCAEVKNAWSYTSTPQYVFMVWWLVKDRDNSTTFTFHIL
jgi:hypothetical protein